MNPYQYLNNLDKFGNDSGYKPGLKRVNRILAEFDHPESGLDFIHVAGSNGKGSTIAFLNSIYRSAGYKTGVYISPPLFHFNERIRVDDNPITTDELRGLVSQIKPVVSKVARDKQLGQPTFFEVVTAIAFLYFAKKDPDLVILETGLGGRLDATNIIKKPLVSLITSISREHTDILGNSIKKIAREKGGIIKNSCPVLTGVENEAALRVIEDIARKRRAELVNIDDNYNYRLIESNFDFQKYELKNRKETVEEENIYNINLRGEYQVRNSILALAAVSKLDKILPVNEKSKKIGLKKAGWPGRLELINKNPYLFVDGAHNPQSCKKLSEYLATNISSGQKLYYIISVLKDKDIEQIIENLIFRENNIEILITKNKNRRALAPAKIKQIVDKKEIKNRIYSNIRAAIKNAGRKAEIDDIICITGSLYTVAEAKIFLQKGINTSLKT